MRAGGQRREVQAVLPLGTLAQPVRAAVEVDAGQLARRVRDDELAEHRHGRARGRADEVRGHDDLAPREHVELLLGGDRLERRDGDALLGLVDRQERHADRVEAGRRQLGVDDVAQERVGDLREDAGAVAAVLLGADGAAVVEVEQRGQAGVDDVPAGRAAQRGDEGETARVVLGGGVVETLRQRRAYCARARGRRRHLHRPHGPRRGRGIARTRGERGTSSAQVWRRYSAVGMDRPHRQC